LSATLTHKTDVGGVRLDVRDATAVRAAWYAIESSVTEKAGAEHFAGVTVQPMAPVQGYELIIGSSVDAQFGPVLLFGAGGQLVEVFKDRALGLPPLNATLARRLIEQTRIYTALKGVRGRPPVDFAALERALVAFSNLVVEQPWIKEIEINPLLATAERVVALDARVILQDAATAEDAIPRPAIRPYPVQYIRPWKLRDGTPVTIRPIRPEDEPSMVGFHEGLSPRSVYFRYFTAAQLRQRVAHERLSRLCFVDYDREIALVVENGKEILGVGRLVKLHATNEAEFALIVSDGWQKQGLGTRLLAMLVEIGRDEKLDAIRGTILAENREMQHVAEKLGFQVRGEAGDSECEARILLRPSREKAVDSQL
jgi:acetyltransferase